MPLEDNEAMIAEEYCKLQPTLNLLYKLKIY